MYANSFGFRLDPFSLDSENGFFYKNADVESTFCQLTDRIRSGRGVLMVTGEAGTGKTALLRELRNQLGPEVNLIYGQSKSSTFPESLHSLCNDLGLDPEKKDIIEDLQSIGDCPSSQQQTNQHIAFCIDDAHQLEDDILKKLLLLSIPSCDETTSVQIILTGRRQLERRISKIALSQAKQINTVCFRLKSLDALEVGSFIKQRLEAVDYHNILFTDDAISHIVEYSNGIPRVVNNICTSALSAADAENKRIVTAEIIDQIAEPNRAPARMDDDSKEAEESEYEEPAGKSNSFPVQERLIDIQNKQSVIDALNTNQSGDEEIITQAIKKPKTPQRFMWGLTALLVFSIATYLFFNRTVSLPLAKNYILNIKAVKPQRNIKIEKNSGDIGRSNEARVAPKESNYAEEMAEPGVRARQFITGHELSEQSVDLDIIYNQAEKSMKQGQSIDAYLLYFYAAKRSHGNAAFKLAQLFDPAIFKPRLGLIEKPNVTQANKWYLIAANAGHPNANHFWEQLRTRVTKQAAAGDEKSKRLVLQF